MEHGFRRGARPIVDLDVHGIVGIRLRGASSGDVAAVVSQVGGIPGRFEAPDIVVEFVDHLAVPSNVRYIGLDDAAFGAGDFYLFRGRGRARVAARIALDGVGTECRVVCQSGAGAVPLLVSILNMTALAKGYVPLHASAFKYGDRGILATGWTKGGKTEALLAFMANGASYIGDEWVYVSPGGRTIHGLRQPLTLWDWHLDDLPRFRERLPSAERSKLRASRLVQGSVRRAPRRVIGRRTVDRIVGMAQGQLSARVDPEDLFGAEACIPRTELDTVLFLVSQPGARVTTSVADPRDIADRMSFSCRLERLDLHAAYLKFRFAYPGRPNPLIERADELERDGLGNALDGKAALLVEHPYPAPIPAIFESVSAALERSDSRG